MNCHICQSQDIYDNVCLDCCTIQKSQTSSCPEWTNFPNQQSAAVRCKFNIYEIWKERKRITLSRVKDSYVSLCQELDVNTDEVNTLFDKYAEDILPKDARHRYIAFIAFVKGACLRYICKKTGSSKRDLVGALSIVKLQFPTSLPDYCEAYGKIMSLNKKQITQLNNEVKIIQIPNGLTLSGVCCALLLRIGCKMKSIKEQLKLSDMTIKNSYNQLYVKKVEGKKIQKSMNPIIQESLYLLNKGGQEAAIIWYNNQHLTSKEIDNMLHSVSLPTVRKAINIVKAAIN